MLYKVKELLALQITNFVCRGSCSNVYCLKFILKNKNFQVMGTLLNQMHQYPG